MDRVKVFRKQRRDFTSRATLTGHQGLRDLCKHVLQAGVPEFLPAGNGNGLRFAAVPGVAVVVFDFGEWAAIDFKPSFPPA